MNRAQIFELATGRFIAQREDALLLGPPGTGKSHLAQAIGRGAIRLDRCLGRHVCGCRFGTDQSPVFRCPPRVSPPPCSRRYANAKSRRQIRAARRPMMHADCWRVRASTRTGIDGLAPLGTLGTVGATSVQCTPSSSRDGESAARGAEAARCFDSAKAFSSAASSRGRRVDTHGSHAAEALDPCRRFNGTDRGRAVAAVRPPGRRRRCRAHRGQSPLARVGSCPSPAPRPRPVRPLPP
jgi:hypothetical protein